MISPSAQPQEWKWWVQTLLTPLGLIVTVILVFVNKNIEDKHNAQRYEQAVISSYISNMTSVLEQKPLLSEDSSNNMPAILSHRSIVQAKTPHVLFLLKDKDRRQAVIEFLRHSKLGFRSRTLLADKKVVLGFNLVVSQCINQFLEAYNKKSYSLSNPYTNILSGIDFTRIEGIDLSENDLTGIQLIKVKMNGANLRSAILNNAMLSSAILSRANLAKVYLFNTDLENAYLRDVNLNNAIIVDTKLQGAVLIRADLEEVNSNKSTSISPNVNFECADLTSASLQKADFSKSNFKGAKLERANLIGANLSKADFKGANLRSASLIKSNLSSSRLEDADLSMINFKLTDLTNANLKNANLSWAINLRKDQIKSACYWEYATYFSKWVGGEWVKDEYKNENFIDKLTQHKPSDPRKMLDCRRWKNLEDLIYAE
ncbi:putative low-complexity protein [Xenococcus sp. PCC 7305]|uniref:pentapeptide repeat-containing protein n=1 Tax=Xenococcus sp. PCC 7305 TaxID=102125 RepID=UPI0002ABF9E0|nr:pentapeptide repeat-containing protein [Xenococcus sp. PCC 7305]ELS04347.1 putative low-complexity protein [Xenococcus sp. PCC 7305]